MIFSMLEQVTGTDIPRPQYPRPQMVREKWMNLNGVWEFEIDQGVSGLARGLLEKPFLDGSILVPFCPESRLSGIGHTDFMASVWYRREFVLPENWEGDRVKLHFGAVDYEARVYVNGKKAGVHRGGYTSFAFEITSLLQPGRNTVAVWAVDDVRSGSQPSGKQSKLYHSHDCDYTRTTGIWQTVWLEALPGSFIRDYKLIPQLQNGSLSFRLRATDALQGDKLRLTAYWGQAEVGRQEYSLEGGLCAGTLDLAEVHPWEVGKGGLYDLTLELLRKGETIDTVYSYFGLRGLDWQGKCIRINGKPVFQRLILDQGFYPDGIYTAPTEDELKNDILRSVAMGFNGARLHQKIFEERFLYWADRLGYIVWGEHASWGTDVHSLEGIPAFLPEWIEAVERDFNHPAIVGWCPFNETWDDRRGTSPLGQDDRVLATVYQVTKAMDPTRPVIDTSGNFHVITDIYDVHDYDQNPDTFAERYQPLAEGEFFTTFAPRQAHTYTGQPYFVSEYGGIKWVVDGPDAGWGYGDAPQTPEEFIERYRGLTHALLSNPGICALCYTQLTDVEQERNGLYTYDRKPKFDPALIASITGETAAIEKEN